MGIEDDETFGLPDSYDPDVEQPIAVNASINGSVAVDHSIESNEGYDGQESRSLLDGKRERAHSLDSVNTSMASHSGGVIGMVNGLLHGYAPPPAAREFAPGPDSEDVK